ncbi:expressed unknown protein [Seminavis robusta]|uniref:Uncharacterized protein n=1 Tax=Seminavis robusta TaxID=568900 RepID=A0A9N8H8V0_9STRA|nr:expressed unknown protein [Seminavis robusta]|eukprot:Sro252_g099710.1 n/a (225) ;mRNA; f:81181-81855
MLGLPSFSELKGNSFLLGWNVGAAATVLLPLLILTISRHTHYNANGNNNDDGGNGDGYRNSWWRWGNRCDGDGNCEQGSNDQTPWWWFGGGSRDPEDEGKGSLIFVYVYATALFVALTLYGNFVFRRNSDFGALQGALLMFTNLAFLAMILVAGLGVETDGGRDLEENGWYGQFSVCVFLTTLFWTIFGIVFVCLLRRNAARAASSSTSSSGQNGYYVDWSDKA